MGKPHLRSLQISKHAKKGKGKFSIMAKNMAIYIGNLVVKGNILRHKYLNQNIGYCLLVSISS